jgi:hypothetical protein
VPYIVTRGGRDVGIAPLVLRRCGSVSLANWVPFPYLGPMVPTPLLGPSLRKLRGRTVRHRAIREQQAFPPNVSSPVEVLGNHGYAVQLDPTFIIDTRPSEEFLWGALDSRCRNKVRKAERNGVRIDQAPDSSTLGRVVREAFTMRGIDSGYGGAFPPSGRELDALRLPFRHALATLDGVPVGALLSIAHAGRAVMWQGGVLREHRNSYANVLLYWDAIRWARGIGCESIDLVGVPDEGIRRFKSQFGGPVHLYAVARRVAVPLGIEDRARGLISFVKSAVSAKRLQLGQAPPSTKQVQILP